LPPGAQPPLASISDVEHRLVFTVLGGSVRIAGFADFVGFTDEADAQRIRALMDIAREIAPDAADYATTARHEWGGFRPMTANSQPIVGPGAVPGLYLNCGHGMLGWTLACASAYRIANGIAG
jgi:D-amino-acid dehydrogenase